MGDTNINPNTYSQVHARENILDGERRLLQAIADGKVESRMDACKLTHHFTARDETYGCHTYARELFIPKGTLLTGKIHKQEHLSFLLKGKLLVLTEFGEKLIEGPCAVITTPGVKRVGYAEEDCIWCDVHLTEHAGEENLDKIEDEVIVKSYGELGLIDSTEELRRLEGKST